MIIQYSSLDEITAMSKTLQNSHNACRRQSDVSSVQKYSPKHGTIQRESYVGHRMMWFSKKNYWSSHTVTTARMLERKNNKPSTLTITSRHRTMYLCLRPTRQSVGASNTYTHIHTHILIYIAPKS